MEISLALSVSRTQPLRNIVQQSKIQKLVANSNWLSKQSLIFHGGVASLEYDEEELKMISEDARRQSKSQVYSGGSGNFSPQ